jgi:hypothetical protein
MANKTIDIYRNVNMYGESYLAFERDTTSTHVGTYEVSKTYHNATIETFKVNDNPEVYTTIARFGPERDELRPVLRNGRIYLVDMEDRRMNDTVALLRRA